MTDKYQVETLLQKYASGTATVSEVNELTNLLKGHDHDEEIKALLEQMVEDTVAERSYDPGKLEDIIQKILGTDHNAKVIPITRRRLFTRVVAAASVVIIIGLGTYFFSNKTPLPQTEGTHEFAIKKDVEAPKGTKAMITLANGQNVLLDSIANGTLATQGNVNVVKTIDGQIAYKVLHPGHAEGGGALNTLTNPRGSNVVDITLADGSIVWLNAGSSVTYPVYFAGKERKVLITGEAYFEVARNAAMPFVVQKNEVSVQVLGTHFNVNTYDNEADIKITLLEGSVKVIPPSPKGGKSNSVILKPGQQALVNPLGDGGSEAKVQTVDINEVMAWKNGAFIFRNTNIEAIMRQVARWYDVEIVYKGNFADLDFGGTVSRKANVSELLKRLEATEAVHFNVEGRRITVMH